MITSTPETETAESSNSLGTSSDVADDAYRLTFEFAPIGILYLSLDGKKLRANRYLCDLTGYCEEELKSLPRWALVHPEDREIARKGLERASGGGGSNASEELRFVRKNGEVARVAVSVALASAADRSASRLILMVEDIRARKMTEEP